MPQKPLSVSEAKDLIRRCLRVGRIILSTHVQGQMKDRKFSIQDIRNVMLGGEIKTITPDQEYGNIKVEIDGGDIEGEGLTVVLALDPDENDATIITGFEPRHRR